MYKISPESFEEATKNEYPFVKKLDDGSVRRYGICPSCLNPIRIVGVAKKTRCRPYGKHAGKDIGGFPSWNATKYIYCPYAARAVHKDPDDEDEYELDITPDVIELYHILKQEFDRVVYIVSKTLGIRCSAAFWKRALQQYLINEGYCYPWLTESNLPYVFAICGLQHTNILGQRFLVGTKLYEAISKHPNAKFVGEGDYKMLQNNGAYLKLTFRFAKHRQYAVNGEDLKESFAVFVDDYLVHKELVEVKIDIDQMYFPNIINSDNNQYRNQQLLEIAEEQMHDFD